MKHRQESPARTLAAIALGLGLFVPGSVSAQLKTLIDCTTGSSVGDVTSRGFYVTNYPGSSINGVTVHMTTQSATPWQYQVGLTVTEGAFDGPIVASWHADATLSSTETPVSIQMVSPPPNQRSNPPVTPGSTLCFKFFVNEQPGAPRVFYTTVGDIGVDLPDSTDPCPNIVQTSGTSPPLSTFRREGVKLQITGNKFLNVNPGWSIQLAIDNADPGDTVAVAPGTYNEDLTFRSDVDVQGAGAGETILQGTGTGDVIVASGVTNMEFSGFTVQGSGTGNPDAGLEVISSDIVVRNNTFTDNATGIRTSNSNSFFCSNLVTGNGNSDNAGVDYAIRCAGSDLFSGNRIVLNDEGGVLSIGPTSAPQLINNTISDNVGRGMHAAASAAVTLKNNILSGNGSQGIFAENSATVQSTYNCLFGNSPNYAEVSGGTITSRLGDIQVDPLFDPAQPGAYFLSENSSCVDAGDPAAIYSDIDGSRSDIGATGGLCGSTTPPGSVVSGFVWTSVGTIATFDIDQSTGAKRGLTLSRDRPFGGTPWLFGAFGTSETAVHRYAVQVAKWTGNTPPAPAAFDYVDDPLSKVRYDISGGMLVAERVALGPFDFFGRPSYVPTRNSGNIFWAHENLRLVLNTLSLDKGTYSVRVEAFDFFGNAVSFTVNRDLVIHVNNTRPVVSIDAVSFGGGAPFDECSIIDLPSNTSTLGFVYTASHADGFLDDYSLVALVGRNRSGGTIVSDAYSNHPDPNAVWNGETTTAVAATPVSPEQSLPNLQLWETCAYQFRIRAWARTTNGFGRLYPATFFDNYAIDLEPPVVCTPDLDGDGDVDSDDLNIMAAAYGSTTP